MALLFVADENIPFVEDAFCEIGTIQTYSGRDISSNNVKNADVLLVRSITKVNAELLMDSSVKIVCSATIGTDHIDLDFLNQNGIAFSNATGSNANSVSEYIVAVLLELVIKYDTELSNLTLGIVGVGNIGKLVKRIAQGLGISVLLNDPPLARQARCSNFENLDELMQADIITIHVPLSNSGEDKTFHLFDDERIKKMKKGSILINTSRGSVVDNKALKKAIKSQHLSTAILDVWENEPTIDLELLNMVEVGTPHIAGYSLDGKANGTFQIYKAVCEYFEIKSTWNPKQSLPSIKNNTIQVGSLSNKLEGNLVNVIRNVYNIKADNTRLKKQLQNPDLNPDKYFDKLRKEYPVRREFSNYKIHLDSKNLLSPKLKLLGFIVDEFHREKNLS